MLIVQPQLQRLLAIRVQRQQIQVLRGSPVQHAPAAVHRRIKNRGCNPTILRLHVEYGSVHGKARVVTKQHAGMRLDRFMRDRHPQNICSPHLTQRRLTRYYSATPMSESGLHAYAPLLIHLILALALASALTAASVLVGWKRPNRAKQQAYECGVEPIGDAREPFSVKFYLVAMVFILFDVEAIFLYPWAYIYRDMFKISHSFGVYGFVEMLIYIAILLVGYIYLWKKGAFDWHH